jgi:oxalate decarboxylase
MRGSYGVAAAGGEGALRGSRRDALRLLGAGAGIGALVAAGSTRTVAFQGEATPAAPNPTATATAAPESLFFSLGDAASVLFPSGTGVRFARAAEFPALSGLSLAMFDVAPEATRELHWHNNAGELGWCLGGSGRMVILDEAGVATSFVLGAGSVFFAPKGLPHAFWATGAEPVKILLCFDHPQPATIDFSQMMAPLPLSVVAQAAGVAPTDVPTFPPVAKQFAAPVPGGTAALPGGVDDPAAGRYTARIDEVGLERFPGGSRNRVSPTDIAALSGVKTTLMTLEPGATRNPHWHPAMNEVCFVLEGQIEIGAVGPNGVSQAQVLSPAEIAFIPVNWLHYELAPLHRQRGGRAGRSDRLPRRDDRPGGRACVGAIPVPAGRAGRQLRPGPGRPGRAWWR